jgi:hypothetical protein
MVCMNKLAQILCQIPVGFACFRSYPDCSVIISPYLMCVRLYLYLIVVCFRKNIYRLDVINFNYEVSSLLESA